MSHRKPIFLSKVKESRSDPKGGGVRSYVQSIPRYMVHYCPNLKGVTAMEYDQDRIIRLSLNFMLSSYPIYPESFLCEEE